MADLYNLLDGINESQQEEDHDLGPTLEEGKDESEEWDLQDRERLELPPALAEAERRKLQHVADDEGELEEEEEVVNLKDLEAERESLQDLPYMQLRQFWSQELHSPELLPYPEAVLTQLTEAVKKQENRLEEFAENEATTGDSNMDSLIASLLRIDADRANFLICDSLKQRLFKIEDHPLYMREKLDCMSDKEVVFLKEYGTMLEHHLRRTVTDHFPQDAWKKLDEPEMIDEPNLDTYVFVRSKEDVSIENGTEENPDPQQHDAGACLIVRYSRIRNLVLEGKLELLV